MLLPAAVLTLALTSLVPLPGSASIAEPSSPDVASIDAADDFLDAAPRGPDRPEPLSPLTVGGPTKVEIVYEPGDAAAVEAQIAALGGRIVGTSPGLFLVELGSGRIGALEASEDVEYVRTPVRVDLPLDPTLGATSAFAIDDVHVTETNAAAWHLDGHTGAGVKVGIIDFFNGSSWTTSQSASAVPAPAGTFCRYEGVNCDLWSAPDDHGVSVAEIIYDMAPGATFYLATVGTTTDLQAAVNWFDSQGVHIINRSLASQLDGPGNGTGGVDSVVADAVSRGMLFVQAAGNHAAPGGAFGGYWRGSWADTDSNGWLDFTAGDEALGFLCGYIQGFRWSDWGANRSDYDVYIVDLDTAALLATSLEDQTAGAPPLELIDGIDCDAHPVLGLLVNRYSAGGGSGGDVLEFMASATAFEYSQNPYSASHPAADSASAGMLTVGAIDPADGGVIADYSSQGPTNDGRLKPNVTAPSCLPTVASSPSCFNGTSAATPVVAGAAALVWGAGVATSPSGVADWMKIHTIDLGAAGPDQIYGRGQIYLGAPPLPSLSINNTTVTEGSPAQFQVTLSFASDDTVTVNYATTNGSAKAPGDYTAKSGVVTFPPGDTSETITVTTIDDGNIESVETFWVNLSTPSNADINEGTGLATLFDINSGPTHTIGLVNPSSGQWHLYDDFGNLVKTFYFGNPGDFPIMGDWNGDGIETPGMYRQSDGYVYLRNSNTEGIADIKFFFGNPGDVPLAGDFNGDGKDTVSIYRPGQARFYIINELGENNGGLGAAEFSYLFGNAGDKPIVGDFEGDGIETVGLHRESTGLVYFRNSHTQGIADDLFIYGDPDDRLVAGDWTGDGMFSPAIFRPSNTMLYLRYTNSAGNANFVFPAGQGHWLPVSGVMAIG